MKRNSMVCVCVVSTYGMLIVFATEFVEIAF